MPRSIFSRRSSKASRSSKVNQEECRLLTRALKDVARRFVICYKTLCCFPLDQIVPSNHRKIKNGLNLYFRPTVNQTSHQTSQKVLPEIKIVHVLPRSKVSFYDPGKAKSEITAAQIENEIATAQIRSEIATIQTTKSEIVTAKTVTSDTSNTNKARSIASSSRHRSKVSFEKQIASIFIEKVKTAKISRTRMLKEKSRKIFDYGSDSIRSKFKHRKKSSGSFRSTDTSLVGKKNSSNDVHSENRWIRTRKRMIKISNPAYMKWMRHTKPRSITTSSTDNDESGDGPETPKLSGDKKIPLRWNMVQEGFSDTDFNSENQVKLEII